MLLKFFAFYLEIVLLRKICEINIYLQLKAKDGLNGMLLANQGHFCLRQLLIKMRHNNSQVAKMLRPLIYFRIRVKVPPE